MKRKAALLIAAFMIMSLALPLAVLAEGLYDEASPRVIDNGGALDAAHAQDLMDESLSFSEEYEMDFVFVVVNADEYQSCGGRLGSLADDIYDEGGYGWGEDRSAAIALWCPEYEEYHYQAYGWASEVIDEDEIDFISERSPGYEEEYGDWGVLYASLRFTSNYLDDVFQDINTLPPEIAAILQGEQTTDQSSPVSADPQPVLSSRPDWYPEDPQNFTFFHDEDAPRVVDVADIFTPEEEARIESRAREIINETGRDVVVFTDVSSYGLEQNVYCADFYDFNGYGFGPEREGLCLLFCMDPNDRGFMTVATGSKTRAVFTESSSNSMDDLLYDYAVQGEFGAGVIAWLDTVESLYTKGVPFAPDWLPDADANYVRTPRAASPQAIKSFVDDRAGLLYDDEAASLEAMARSISETYGIDVMIHTTRDIYNMRWDEYLDNYYYYNGIGLGQDYDGILIAVTPYSSSARIYADGKVRDKLTEVNRSRIVDHSEDDIYGDRFFEGFSSILKDVDHMMRTGRVARSLSAWLGSTALGTLLGGSLGGVSFGAAKSTMKEPKTRTAASEYISNFRLLGQSDNYLYTTTSRVYDPPSKSSSGGGSSGGHSSYSGSFHSSSGASHSSSGRKF